MPTITPSSILTETPQPPEWVIDRFLPRDTITILAGLEGIGKSSLSYALALSVATGQSFLDRMTTQLRVLYFDSENSKPDFSEYLRQLWIGMGSPDPKALDEFLRIEHFSLAVDWQPRFKAACVAWNPGLVIIDTANSCFSVEDENSNAEAAEIVSFISQTRPARASVILMKHEREAKDGMGKSVRGAKYWLGAVDQVVYLNRVGGHPIPPYGLYRTKLTPAKKRAYGLDEAIVINPIMEQGPYGKSLKLCRH